MINVRNIGFGTIKPDKLEFIAEETVRRLSSHLLKAGDIVFGRKGAVERHVFIQEGNSGWFQGSDCLRLRVVDARRALPRYLSYVFLGQQHQEWMMQQCSHGATMASLNQDIIRRIPLRLPPLPTQQRIAAILSAYDDLIENNTRRIAILEEMARRLYEEWFVHFRFPTDAATSVVGARLLDIADVAYGKGLPSKHLTADGDYPVYGAAKVIGRYTAFTEVERTIIAGCRGSVGKFTITEPKCFVTNNSFTFKPKDPNDFLWFYYALADRGLEDVVSGSAQPQITLASLSNVELSLPTADDRTRFSSIVQSWIATIWTHQRKNANLRAQRDMLLPKLISGEIDVSGAEEMLEAAE